MNQTVLHRKKHFRDTFSNLYSNDLNGTDEWVDHGAASKLLYEYADNFSSSCWINADANGLLSGLITYNDSFAAESNGWMFVHHVNKIRFYINVSTNIESNDTITTGLWYHVMITASPGKLMKLYINGSLQSATTTYGSITYGVNHNNLRIGVYGGIRFFNGKIAYPKIFDKELSQSEVNEDYALKMLNWRGLSFKDNVKFAGIFKGGQADYPILTDDVGGINGTMTNQESVDITTDIPT